MQKIILASQSPRRKMLLEWAEVPFEVVSKSIDESFPAHLPLADIPVFIARNKAQGVDRYLDEAYHQQHSRKTILAADTVVILENEVINKPESYNDAVRMLAALSGKTHRVITGVVVLHNGVEVAFSDTTEVVFNQLSKWQIEYYVEKFKPYDKAGAYAIQEYIGVVGVQSIKGDYYNVMGLPVNRVVKALHELQQSGE